MLVIYPFSLPDEKQALKNAQWIAELGEYKSHDIFILADRRCTRELVAEVVAHLTPVFKVAQLRVTQSDIDGWPEGANHMFTYATALIQHTREWPYFLWLEPDAIPIRPGWLDSLEEEYKLKGKPFMGERVDLGEKRPDVPVHMSGVAIYQNPIYLLAGEAYRAHETAWDIAAKDQIIPNAHWTKQIQHYWKHGTFTNLEGLRPETMVFHSSKDGSLIDLLRLPKRAIDMPKVQDFIKQMDKDLAAPDHEPPKTIKILPHNGIWVLDGDTIISDEVERNGRLDFDSLLPHILPLIRPGDTVVDVGAFIGDHTVAYSYAVGKAGKVIAYEPNPLAYQCLIHNTEKCGNVFTFCTALGSSRESVQLTDLPNAASNYIGSGREVHVRPMDWDESLFLQINLIKIDVEGYELEVLKGAEKLIEKFHPQMVIEINEIALKRQNTIPGDIVQWVCAHGYKVSMLHQHKDAPFYDILAAPVKPPENSQAAFAHDSTAPAPVATLSTRDRVRELVKQLKEISEQSPLDKSIVMQHLVINGLKQSNKATQRKRGAASKERKTKRTVGLQTNQTQS